MLNHVKTCLEMFKAGRGRGERGGGRGRVGGGGSEAGEGGRVVRGVELLIPSSGARSQTSHA